MSFNLTVRKDGDRSTGNNISPLLGATFLADGTSDFNIGPTDAAGNATMSIPSGSYTVKESVAPAGFNTIASMCIGPFANPVSTPYQEVVNLNQNRSTRRFINWRDNPPYPETCGLRIALILDRSTSISDSEWMMVQAAAKAFVNVLVNTGDNPPVSEILLITFGTLAVIRQVAGQDWTSIYLQAGADAVNAVIDSITPPSSSPTQYTNWDAAFRLVSTVSAQVVVLITDGNPTAYNLSPTVTGSDVTFETMEAAIASANLAKISPMLPKVIGVGVGDGLSDENIKLVSGPTLNDDYFLATDFNDLLMTLNQVAVLLCGMMICVHEDTLVATPAGSQAISALRSGDLVSDVSGSAMLIKHTVSTGQSSRFVKINAGALGAGCPAEDLLLTRGHPVLAGGKEIECQKLLNGSTITEVQLSRPAKIYTLATERRSFVSMQGLPVGTWSEAALENMLLNDSRAQRLSVEYQ